MHCTASSIFLSLDARRAGSYLPRVLPPQTSTGHAITKARLRRPGAARMMMVQGPLHRRVRPRVPALELGASNPHPIPHPPTRIAICHERAHPSPTTLTQVASCSRHDMATRDSPSSARSQPPPQPAPRARRGPVSCAHTQARQPSLVPVRATTVAGRARPFSRFPSRTSPSLSAIASVSRSRAHALSSTTAQDLPSLGAAPCTAPGTRDGESGVLRRTRTQTQTQTQTQARSAASTHPGIRPGPFPPALCGAS
ncbi:hypothetical protein BD413DRAFT_226978 [Trametes elegans]|nr:hypothetical protein BD413DRAFT_226978 [Trametes elegans]